MAQRKTSHRSYPARGKKGTGCLIWLILLLVTLLLFVLNWDRIKSTIDSTRLTEALGTRDEGASEEPGAEPPAFTGENPAGQTPASPTETNVPPAGAVSTPAADQQTTSPLDGDTTTPPETTPVELVSRTRIAALYFVRVDGDGTITRQEVKRTVDASDSPMTDALNALLKGPTTEELGQNLISLIPSETRLLSAQVRGSTAYLNFNEAFMINRYGIEGYAGQLKQIVYTATGFATVKDVQFLIEGERRDYLGGDGVYIGKPLSRASF
ncbi:MAG: hypothetical protein E4H20_05320 [Spirochaetales bacterium]|nr:MAG: hypothetical protein E4H20_05320 [Spirochaetales bacterium]